MGQRKHGHTGKQSFHGSPSVDDFHTLGIGYRACSLKPSVRLPPAKAPQSSRRDR
jgi:hypothetical protein